ncbi:hypothetical protein [Streptomyces laurentii]|uniref:hypothetical protein n=1 Tax=Streptomyces laurentii TaxID=39478 RepID=UPI0036A0EB5B
MNQIRRVFGVLAVTALLAGLGAGAASASTAGASETKCLVAVLYNGKWIEVEVPCNEEPKPQEPQEPRAE